MNNLLSKVIKAHGGIERWQEFEKVRVSVVSSGKFFELLGIAQDRTPRELTVYLHEERASLKPYGAPDKQTSFTPERIAIEKLDGEVLMERTGTPEDLHHHMKGKEWDALDRAYFNGYAMWTYLTTPFFMLMPGVTINEIAPWTEDGEAWQGLRVTFPPNVATHSKVQDFYFGDNFLLRRHDYLMDVAGYFHGAQTVSDFTEVNGILLPTKRRAYKRGEDYKPDLDELMMSIDYSNIQFS